MKEIKLTQGKVALVDDDMFEELNQFKWQAVKNYNMFYARRSLPRINGKRPQILMHHEIIGRSSKGLVADHKDGNGLRNLRSNLRFVTYRQNIQNLHNIKKSSQYSGVSWHKDRQKWQANIWINGVKKYLGLFIDEFEAFEVYRKAVNAIGQTVIDYD